MIQEIDPQTLNQRLSSPDAPLLVDIRSQAEVAQGMLPDALYIPMHLLPLRMNELPRDRDLVLYCRSGARSYHACAFLLQQGFTNAINLRGGIIAWARAGNDIELPQMAAV